MPATLQEALRPSAYRPVRELVRDARVDVSDWEYDRDGRRLENPNLNVHKSYQWSFGGGAQPTVVCIWYDGIDWSGPTPIYASETRGFQDELNKLAAGDADAAEKQRLRAKANRARAFNDAIYKSRRDGNAVWTIILAGRFVDTEDAALDSSRVARRHLDDEPWFVHEYDPATTRFKLVRGVRPTAPPAVDPFAGLVDPGADEAFQNYVGELSDTEREALTRLRVGQGPFRDALIKRWGACSVTGCAQLELLVASHIKPWSRCISPAERLGSCNGLLLVPNLDKAFDRGLITFDDRCRVQISPGLSSGVALALGVDRNLRLRQPAGDDLLPYLQWHQAYVFRRDQTPAAPGRTAPSE